MTDKLVDVVQAIQAHLDALENDHELPDLEDSDDEFVVELEEGEAGRTRGHRGVNQQLP